jgi:hypothetical protein
MCGHSWTTENPLPRNRFIAAAENVCIIIVNIIIVNIIINSSSRLSVFGPVIEDTDTQIPKKSNIIANITKPSLAKIIP